MQYHYSIIVTLYLTSLVCDIMIPLVTCFTAGAFVQVADLQFSHAAPHRQHTGLGMYPTWRQWEIPCHLNWLAGLDHQPVPLTWGHDDDDDDDDDDDNDNE